MTKYLYIWEITSDYSFIVPDCNHWGGGSVDTRGVTSQISQPHMIENKMNEKQSLFSILFQKQLHR